MPLACLPLLPTARLYRQALADLPLCVANTHGRCERVGQHLANGWHADQQSFDTAASPYQGPQYGDPQFADQPHQYDGAPYQDQPYQGQPYQAQPYQVQPYRGQPYRGQPPPTPSRESRASSVNDIAGQMRSRAELSRSAPATPCNSLALHCVGPRL